MPTPNPADALKMAEEIFNSFWPVISLIGSITVYFWIISAIGKMFRGPVYDESELVAMTRPGPTYPISLDDEYEDEEQGEPDDPQQVVYLECKRCNGVTPVFGGSGRCQYCGGVL